MKSNAKKLVIILMIFVLVIGIVVQAVLMASPGFAEIKDPVDYSVTRVNLSTVKKESDGSVYVTVKGEYKINDGSTVIPYGTKINLKKSGSNIVMSWGNESVNMGTKVEFIKQDTTTEGLQILNSARGTLVNYLGNITVTIDSSGSLYFLNTINLETYLMGVVPYEMSDSFPIEALKVQAIAARTVAARYNARGGIIIDTESAQVYFGYNAAHTNAKAAIEATKGNVLKYNGSLIEVFYSQSNGGQTSQVTCAWPSGANLPYYAVVDDPADLASMPPTTTVKLPKTVNSTYTLDSKVSAILRTEVKNKLASQGMDVEASEIEILKIKSVNIHTPKCSGHECNRYLYAGMTLSIGLTGQSGGVVTGELKPGTGSLNIRDGQGASYKLLGSIPEGATFTILDMSGTWFKLEYNGIVGYSSPNFIQIKETDSSGESTEEGTSQESDVSIDVLMSKFNSKKTKTLTEDDNYFYIQCRGSHGIGMSQYAARQRAKDGELYTDIIAFYYIGAYLEEVNTGSSVAQEQPDGGKQYIYKGTANVDDFLNIRKSPSSTSEILGMMLPNDVCEVLEQISGTSWAKVKFGEIEGYASTLYLTIERIEVIPPSTEAPTELPTETPSETPTESVTVSPSETPSVTPTESVTVVPSEVPSPSPSPTPTPTPSPSPTPTPTPSPSPSPTPTPTPSKATPTPSEAAPKPSATTVYTAKLKEGTGGLNVRSGKGTSYSKLMTLREGITFTVLDTSSSWYKVSYNGVTGYASKNYIVITGSSTVTVTPTPSKATPTPSKATPTPSEAAPKPSATTVYTAKLKEGTGGLNVRSGKGTSYSKLMTLREGITFTVLDTSSSWYKVSYNGVTGYASKNYIVITGSSSASVVVPTPTPSKATPTPSKATPTPSKPTATSTTASGFTAELVDGTGRLRIRSGRSTGTTTIGYINEGETFTVLAQYSDGWSQVKYGSITGYSSSQYIKKVTTTSAQTTGTVNVSASSVLNVRSGPSTGNSVIGTLRAGNKVTVLQDLDDWLKISYSGTTGYVSSDYIKR